MVILFRCIKRIFWSKFIVIFFLWTSFLSCQSRLDQATKERDLFLSVFLVLSQYHFIQKNYNQKFYDDILDHYLKITDLQKIFYLQSEVDTFKQLSQYSGNQQDYQQELMSRIPNLLKISYTCYDIFKKRAIKFQEFSEDYLSREIDFTVNEVYELKPEKRHFSIDEKGLKETWRKYLKYLTMNRIVTLSSGNAVIHSTEFRSNEMDARSHILNQMKRVAQNTQTRKSDQYIEFYLNAVGAAYDQYTSYYSPVESQNFNIQMTGQLEGIGAQISKEEDGLIEIKGIVPGGPTYKQKALEVGDKIMRVNDGNGKMLDVVSLSMNEALSYIRGKKGTVAQFLVKRRDGVIENVEIIRDRVILEESYARSTILQTQIDGSPTKKIGYLYLPSFYGDRRNSQAPNSSDDVKKALLNFNDQDVDGMIFDLRNNGGGYLDDAVNISGFFIEEGPIVRVRDRNQEFDPRSDTDPNVIFTKPMIVLINENSASASEIFSAAMQDYGRAVIVGSLQSFGKATVQNVLEFDKQPYFHKIADIAGSLKYTIQKYYRVTGQSTQTMGVTPDVILPTLWIKQNHKNNPYAQDSLPEIPFKHWERFSYDIDYLRQSSQKRIDHSDFFNRIKKRLQILKERQDEDRVSLVYTVAQRKQNAYLKEIDKYDLNLSKSKVPYSIIEQKTFPENPSEKMEGIKNWNKSILDDYYLEEGVMILNDFFNNK